jgi:hypothetical protein
LELRIKAQGENHPNTLIAQGSLALNLLAQEGRAELAIVPARAAVIG